MTKAIFLLTPALKDDGSDYNLYLSLEVQTGTDGTVTWSWWLPQQFGYARTDTGTAVRDQADGTTLLFTNSNGDEGMKMTGVNPGGPNDFPFTSADQDAKSHGPLVIEVDNTYLKTGGGFTWTVDSVS